MLYFEGETYNQHRENKTDTGHRRAASYLPGLSVTWWELRRSSKGPKSKNLKEKEDLKPKLHDSKGVGVFLFAVYGIDIK